MPNKSIRLRKPGSISTSDTRDHHEHRTAPCTQRRDIPGESVEEVQATTAGASRFVEFHSGRVHVTDFHDRCLGHNVYAVDGFEQTEEASVPGHELLVTRSRDRARAHHRCGCGWCLDDGPDEIPD